jgi:hypothetical protein
MKINNVIVLTALLLTATAQGFTGGDGFEIKNLKERSIL